MTSIIGTRSTELITTSLKIAIVAYLLQRWKNIKFCHAFLGLFAWHMWNDKIGITLLACFAVHHLISHYQEEKAAAARGRVVGGGHGHGHGGTTNSRSMMRTTPIVHEQTTSHGQKSVTDTAGDATDMIDSGITANRLSSSQQKDVNYKSDTDDNKSIKTRRQRRADETQNHSPASTTTGPLTSSKSHPGLDGFHRWMEAISDIYRVYAIGKEGTGVEEPFVPHLPRSESGRVSVNMEVTNSMISDDIDVYWINYKGREEFKGTINNNYHQVSNGLRITTWVGHPWVFRRHRDQQFLLHFIPYRVLPVTSIEAAKPTTNDSSIGLYNFSIAEPNNNSNDICSVVDNIIPYPPNEKITSINHALEFSCQQMEREDAIPTILLKYLYNIVLHPTESKYRQIRTSNKVFWNNIWINGGRGVLHALGFEERGPFVEMGPNTGSLPGERLKHLADAIVMLEELEKDRKDMNRHEIVQPHGADGYTGRAGWHI